jgi:hypothetical protein
MAARFVNLDRLTPMFLACDLREWVPAGHIVHFILEAVEQLPTEHFQVNQCPSRGGRRDGDRRRAGQRGGQRQTRVAGDGGRDQPGVAPEVQAILADSGFYSEAAVQAVEQKADVTATGMTIYAAVEKTGHHKTVADLLPQPEPEAAEASAKEKMAHRLKTKIGRELYKPRKQTVEPVFGIIKEVMGFRRFSLRGHAKVSLEWTLVCVS